MRALSLRGWLGRFERASSLDEVGEQFEEDIEDGAAEAAVGVASEPVGPAEVEESTDAKTLANVRGF